MLKVKRSIIFAGLVLIIGLALAACSPITASPTQQAAETTLSVLQIKTLSSLKKVDDFPLYTMHYYGTGGNSSSFSSEGRALVNAKWPPRWGCSLFAAMGGTDKFYGRNFDWDESPALLLFNHPKDGYDSVSMVDVVYLGVGGDIKELTDLPLEQRKPLLDAPAIPFDGMNERGLVVGMAAVPSGIMQLDSNKETMGSLMLIRRMLDQAGDVDEAVAILESYNIVWEGGPPLHYLIADRSGRAVLAEFHQGRLQLLPNEHPWHLATNFLVSAVTGSAVGQCGRYDRLDLVLSSAQGSLDAMGAMSLLEEVSQQGTQWSIVYGFSTGDVTVAMGRQYDRAHAFHVDLKE